MGSTRWALPATAPMSAPALTVSATTTRPASSTANGSPWRSRIAEASPLPRTAPIRATASCV